jgi:hypothetical protein
MATKADKLTVEQRVEAVYHLIMRGWTTPRIVENSIKVFGIKQAMAYRYLDDAWERVRETAAPERSEHLARAIAAHYQMLDEAKTIKEKLAVWAALSRLLGLDAPKAVEIGGPGGEALRVIIEYADRKANIPESA